MPRNSPPLADDHAVEPQPDPAPPADPPSAAPRRTNRKRRPPAGAVPNNGPRPRPGAVEERDDQAAPPALSKGPIRALAEVLLDLRAVRRRDGFAEPTDSRLKVVKADAAPTAAPE